jgi:mono/diheme cytochrome c family protein
MRKLVLWIMAGVFLGAALLVAPPGAWAQDGKKIYEDKCEPCHGEKGDGKGAMCTNFKPPPGNFTDPKFWQGDPKKMISDSITKGKNQMIPVDLKPAEIKAVTEYITKTFKK